MAVSSVSRASLSEQDSASADDLREVPTQDDLLNEPWYNGTVPVPISINHSKRERSQNWDQREKCVLVELVRRRLAVIEDKAGDTDAVQRRKQAWRDIHAEFTTKIGGGVTPREVQRMREQWRRMKHWAKLEMTTYQEGCASTTRGKDQSVMGNTSSIPSSQRKPNELAQYICRLMEGYGSGYQFSSEFQTADDPAARAEATDAYQDQTTITDASQEGVRLDEVPVKEEPDSVEILTEEIDRGVSMATAPSFASSPPNPSLRHQPGRRENNRDSSRKSAIPRWSKDFADEVLIPREDDDDDEDDESDLLDSDEDHDFGSYSDWDAEPQPRRQQRPIPSHRRDPACAKLEKMRLAFARQEFKRRMQMMEAEHVRKMQILDIQKETAQLKKKLVFRRLKQRRAPPPSASTALYGRQGHGHVPR